MYAGKIANAPPGAFFDTPAHRHRGAATLVPEVNVPMQQLYAFKGTAALNP